jgi:homocysteine S-methyltransferase
MVDRSAPLPQLSGRVFLTDAGLETDLIFNHGVEIREFASHTLLQDPVGSEKMAAYYRGFLGLARELGTGFVFDVPTWKAHPHWSADLGEDESFLHQANHDAVRFAQRLRDEFADVSGPIVLNAVIGPRGDAYAPDATISAEEAEAYHATQLGWLAETDVDMVTALTHTQGDEAAGFSRAASGACLPHVISFTVETDGRLPTGETLAEAIGKVDAASENAAAYFMVNCAHPDHFFGELTDAPWARRIHGIRCNASRKSHAELDASDTLDDGNPDELAGQYAEIKARMPWLNVFGGCCGSDLRHVTAIARRVAV